MNPRSLVAAFTLLFMAVLVLLMVKAESRPSRYEPSYEVSMTCKDGYLFAWGGTGYGGVKHIIQVYEATGGGTSIPVRCKEEK